VNEYLGEFFGTMILIVLGNGVVAGVLLGRSKSQNAGWIAITAGWAFAVMAGISIARAMGAPGYINPVGPLAGLVTGDLESEKVGWFAMAEFAGAFTGAIMVWLHYLPHWAETPDAATKLAVFCTSPAIRWPIANLVSEVIATFVLVFVAGAIAKNEVGREGIAPLVGGVVWGIGLSLGGTTGYAINPARDLSPRIAHAVLPIPGKGSSDWSYAWIPVLGPALGASFAAVLVKLVMISTIREKKILPNKQPVGILELAIQGITSGGLHSSNSGCKLNSNPKQDGKLPLFARACRSGGLPAAG